MKENETPLYWASGLGDNRIAPAFRDLILALMECENEELVYKTLRRFTLAKSAIQKWKTKPINP